MAQNFVDYLFSIVPPRLKTGYWEQRFIIATGEIMNMFADGAAYAVLARSIDYAPIDALGFMGNDRVLVRGPVESDTNWRARLFEAWNAHQWAGTVHQDGLLGQLRAFGYSSDTDAPELLESQDVGAPARSDYWSRFWVVVPPTCHSYTTAIPDDDQTALRRIIRQFREGAVICHSVVFVVSGYLWDWRMYDTWDEWEASGDLWDDPNTVTMTIEGT